MKNVGNDTLHYGLNQLQQINRLRWILGPFIFAFSLVFFRTTSAWVFGGVLSLSFFLVSVFCDRQLRPLQRGAFSAFSGRQLWQIERIGLFHALLDASMFSALIHLTGGLSSPVPLLMVFYFGLYAVIMPLRILILLNAVGILAYAMMLTAYREGSIIPFIPSYLSSLSFDPFLKVFLQVIFASVVTLGAALMVLISQTLQRYRSRVDQKNHFLERVNAFSNLDVHYGNASQLYPAIADEIKAILGVQYVYLTRWDEENKSVFPAAADASVHAAYLTTPSLGKRENTITMTVKRLQQHVVLENTACSPYLSPSIARRFPNVVSCVGFPLWGSPGQRFLGALILGFSSRHTFDREEIEKYQMVADFAAQIVSRTSLYQETVRRADLLEKFTGKVTDLVSDLKRTTLLPSIVESARSLMNAQYAALHLNRAAGSGVEMACEYAIGLSDTYLVALTRRFNQLVGGKSLRNGDYFIIPDVYQDSRTSPMQDLISGENFRSYAIFSLPAPEGTIGALSLYWLQPHVVSSEEIEVGRLFAERAGTILYSAQIYARITEEALTDALTGLPNRRYLDQRLTEEVDRINRYGGTFSLVMIDLDGFKTINDTYGHPIGDSVIQQVSTILRHALRSSDFLARYGGDEFSVILPETGLEQAFYVAEKLIVSLTTTGLHLPNENKAYLSGCIGLAVFPLDGIRAPDVLNCADQRLYKAKRTGHGSIIFQ